MSEREVFPNPTVKQVVFQIRFPHLFSIENKIGDFQELIMTRFPESAVVFRKKFFMADLGVSGKLENIPDDLGEDFSHKVWQFRKGKNYRVNVISNSLDITSESHKTYNNPSVEDKFRDVIAFVLEQFFRVINVPIIKRIGLRYIDVCPLPTKNNTTLAEWYNTSFPISKYPIERAEAMVFQTVGRRNGHNLMFKEELIQENGEDKLLLDFDAFSTNITSDRCMGVLDELYTILYREFFEIINEPVKEYMRITGEENES